MLTIRFIIRLAMTVAVIIFCTQIGRKWLALSGLIATMPITTLVVLVWLYSDHPGDYQRMQTFTKGVLWGIGPTILFFLVAHFLFRRQTPLAITLVASSAAWLAGAAVHQAFLR